MVDMIWNMETCSFLQSFCGSIMALNFDKENLKVIFSLSHMKAKYILSTSESNIETNYK